jgi:hypothetical protein
MLQDKFTREYRQKAAAVRKNSQIKMITLMLFGI